MQACSQAVLDERGLEEADLEFGVSIDWHYVMRSTGKPGARSFSRIQYGLLTVDMADGSCSKE